MARSAACPTVAALGRRRAGVTLAAAVLAAAGSVSSPDWKGLSAPDSWCVLSPAGVLSNEVLRDIPVPRPDASLTVYENQNWRRGRVSSHRSRCRRRNQWRAA